jgi:phosphoglycerate dehydrogenase-like enzyme
VNKELLSAGKRLKVVGRAGVGVDNIDLKTATERGILVVNAPTGNCVAAAEHTIAHICALSRLVHRSNSYFTSSRFP